jgi:hypothetical protein
MRTPGADGAGELAEAFRALEAFESVGIARFHVVLLDVCVKGGTITITASDPNPDRWPRTHVSCGGVNDYCQGYQGCSKTTARASWDDTNGWCYAETDYNSGSCTGNPDPQGGECDPQTGYNCYDPNDPETEMEYGGESCAWYKVSEYDENDCQVYGSSADVSPTRSGRVIVAPVPTASGVVATVSSVIGNATADAPVTRWRPFRRLVPTPAAGTSIPRSSRTPR